MESQTTETLPTLINGDLTVIGGELIYHDRRIPLEDVTAIKFGWLPIELDMYTIGSRYKLELKTKDVKIKLDFPSYFGFFKKRQHQNFTMLLDAIWDITVVRLVNAMTDDIQNGKSVSIGKCTVSEDGILYKNFLIEWNDLSYQKNYNKLTLNSKSDSSIWTNLYYTETDNVHILTYYLQQRFENEYHVVG